jgi:hypothetical protein
MLHQWPISTSGENDPAASREDIPTASREVKVPNNRPTHPVFVLSCRPAVVVVVLLKRTAKHNDPLLHGAETEHLTLLLQSRTSVIHFHHLEHERAFDDDDEALIPFSRCTDRLCGTSGSWVTRRS